MVSEVMKKDGPGLWHSIHVTAAWADNAEKRAFFCIYVRNITQPNLRCEECRGHMAKYLEAHPPEKAPDPLIWSWEFHNAVNKRLGKPEMEWNTAKKMYLDGEVRNCNQGCGGSESNDKPVSGLISQANISTLPSSVEDSSQVQPSLVEDSPSVEGSTRPKFASPLTVSSNSSSPPRVNDTYSFNQKT